MSPRYTTLFAGSAILLLVAATASIGDAAPNPAQKCAAAKNRAAAKKLGAKLKCHQRAFQLGVAVDPICLATAELKFDKAIVKAELPGGCVVAGDGPAIEAAVDQCVTDIVALTPATATTTTTTSTTTTTTISPLCCTARSILPDPVCYWRSASDCVNGGGVVGAAGSVCDSVSGECTSPPVTPAPNCCVGTTQFPGCAAGPQLAGLCVPFSGTLSTGTCTAAGTCVP